jgi:hypothetical protein
MLAIAGLALLLVWVRWQGSLRYALVVAANSMMVWAFWLPWPVAAGCLFGPNVRSRSGLSLSNLLLGCFLAITIYLGWAHWRNRFYIDFWKYDHGFPYPDRLLITVERWFHARRPVAQGTLKLHGEFPIVSFYLGLIVFAMIGVTGFLVGILMRKPIVRE